MNAHPSSVANSSIIAFSNTLFRMKKVKACEIIEIKLKFNEIIQILGT